MKKSVNIIALISVLAVALCAAVTVCWLDDSAGSVSFDEHFHGSTESAYFADGNGNADSPYLITNQVHLYNFAWLQYLGYFNMKSGFNNGRSQSFFELGADITVDGYTLPPIGTAEYPFIGGFDGKGYKITGLKSSNMQSSFDGKYPDNAQWNGSLRYCNDVDTEVSVVGMFGVVGDYNDWVTNKYSSGVTVNKYSDDGETLEELPETVGDNELYYSGMYVRNMYLDDTETETCTTDTTVGVAAGYVAATVQSVGVRHATVTVAATVSGAVSSYTIIGDYDADVVGWEDNGSDDGGNQSTFGGSIDFRTLARRMNYMFTNLASKQSSIAFYTTYKIGGDYSADNTNGFNFYGTTNLGKTTVQFLTDNKFQFDWNGVSEAYSRGGLREGTYLPLNVALETEGGMGLIDKNTKLETTDDETGVNVSGTFRSTNYNYSWNIGGTYRTATREILEETNTGYIVGGDASTGSTNIGNVILRIQPLSTRGIDNSYIGTVTDSEGVSRLNLEMLTYDKTNNKFAIIEDDYNQSNGSTTLSASYSRKTVSELGLQRYNDKRTSFDKFMGGNGEIYGIRFNKSYDASTDTPLTVTDTTNKINIAGTKYDTYKFVKNGINFHVSKTSGKDSIITAIAGTYYNTSAQPLFALYSVDRSGTDPVLTQVTKVYKHVENNVTTYLLNTNQNDNDTLVFDSSWYQSMPPTTAYYVEIPVPEGDYYIGSASGATAYFMYLDIGANGSTDNPDKQAVYGIDMLHFVGEIPELLGTETNGKWRVFNDYTAASVKLTGATATATIELLRDEATDTSATQIDTTLKYVYVNFTTVTPTGNTEETTSI